MGELSANDLLGLAELFRLATQDGRQPIPDHRFVLLSDDDCRALSAFLLSASIRKRETTPDACRAAVLAALTPEKTAK